MNKTNKVRAVPDYYFDVNPNETSIPVWFLPRTADGYDRMKAQIIMALERADLEATYEKDAVVALRAIGIRRPKD